MKLTAAFRQRKSFRLSDEQSYDTVDSGTTLGVRVMSWKSCMEFTKKYGTAAKVVAGALLNVAAPGSGALLGLVDKAFDLARDGAQDHWESELLRATQRNAAELSRLGRLVELLNGDLAHLCDELFESSHQPEDLAHIVHRALQSDGGLADGLCKLNELALDFACVKEDLRQLIKGQDAMLAILLRLLRVLPFLEECQHAGGDLRELLVHRHTILVCIQRGQFQQARSAVKMIEARAKHGDTHLFKAGIALVEHDSVSVQSELAEVVRRNPRDRELVELHRLATVIATGIRRPAPPGADATGSPNPQEGEILDGWKLEARLGSGGWGQVFKAIRDGNTKALKVMHSKYAHDRDFIERFKKEIGSLLKLPRHDTLVCIESDGFGHCNDRQMWYLAMEYVDGPTLEQYLTRNRPLSEAEAHKVFAPVAEGLGQAHAAGIYHRDIKPSNFVFRRKGQRLVLVDFGLAVHAENLGQTKIGGWTPMFASPEQKSGLPADARSDVYSLAATIYFALLYDKPHLRNPVHFDADQVPESLRATLSKAMEANPRFRYADCREFHTALKEPAPVKPTRKAGDIITNSMGMKLAWIPPGKFLMGSPENEPGHEADETQHEVELSHGFYMGIYLVTQEEYAKVMKANPSYFSSSAGGPDIVAGIDTKRFPVAPLSFREALAFCRRLGEMEGKNYDLPTEAEWECACRAGTLTAYHFGACLSSRQANFDGLLGRSSAVGSYPANDFGLHDMHGNEWEWCKDCYDPGFYANSPKIDPECTFGKSVLPEADVLSVKLATLDGDPGMVKGRVLRGGCWCTIAGGCRSSARKGSAYLIGGGFRLVLSSPEDS